jgi:pimeloyl-ACP methyl ester carboxylesterase/putative sterol carrier protein
MVETVDQTTQVPELGRSDWWEGLVRELNADEEWSRAARLLEVRIEFRHETGSATVDVVAGRAVGWTDGPHVLGSDIILEAPDREWRRILDGETDWFQGNSPGLGEIAAQGNVVAALRNVKAMWLLLAAMARVDGAKRPRREPSPPPKHSGREIAGRYVMVDGLRTYYEEAGEGPPFVCFHAACQDTLMYRQALLGLSDEYRVITLDAPGHGKTLEPEGGPFQDIAQHADFNEAFMEALGLEAPIIAGCSMGGNLVLELGARRPDFYTAIISTEGADYTPTVSEFVLDMLLVNNQEILEGWSQSLIGDRTPPDRHREVVWQIRRATPEAVNGDLRGYAGFDARDRVGAIRCPVLLLRGDADWLVPQEAVEATASRIPDSEVAVLAGTGHYPMIENPYEHNETIRDFLKRRTKR